MEHQSWMAKSIEMRLNHKQKEIIDLLVKEIEARFPDTKFVEVNTSPESEDTLWIEFTKPEDDDRILDIIEYASERTTDILLDYGYHMLVLPVAPNGMVPARA